ncbi:MAG: phosphohistidine phosphatase SixA [Vicinamibacterales bacterium]
MADISLFLVRHAIAADRGDDWPDDGKRPITSEGAAKMRRAIAGLRALDVKLDIVFTSPLTRAMETAELIVSGLKPAPALKPLPALAPGGTPARIAEAIVAEKDVRTIALVGHEPGLGELAGWLIGARTPLLFKKGGICRIDVAELPPGRTGQLVWFATPKMLRALGHR